MRVRHLIEDEDEFRIAQRIERLWGERLRFDQDALVHGVGTCDLVDRLRFDDLHIEGQGALVRDFQALQCIAGHHHARNLPRRIIERRAHGVQTIEMDHAVGRPFARGNCRAFALGGRAAKLGVAMGPAQLCVMAVLVARFFVFFAHVRAYSGSESAWIRGWKAGSKNNEMKSR